MQNHKIIESNIYQNVSHFVKMYPTFTRLYEFDQNIKIRKKGFEEINPKIKKPIKKLKTQNEILEFIQNQQSLRRAKTKISDITLSNNFEMFFTFTFNCKSCNQNCENKPCVCDDKCKRHDVEFCKKRLSKWLKNQREIHGKFDYLIVPEYHKDGKSIHFHGLIKNYKGTLQFSKKYKNGRKIYNIKSYTAGYSTAVKIDNIKVVSTYIKKYILKEMPLFKGKKRYWTSKALTRPEIIFNPKITFEEYEKFEKTYAFKNLTIFETSAKIESLTKSEVQEWKMYKILTTSLIRSMWLHVQARKRKNLIRLFSSNLMMDTS